MTPIDPAGSIPNDAPRTSRSRGTPDVASPPSGATRAWLLRLRGRFAFRFAPSRNPDAGSLTDRQLSDIGLTRSDLRDGKGWRR